MSVYIVCCWAVYRQCLVYVTFKCYHYLSALLFGCCCCCCYSLIFINISKAALVKCFISFRFASFHFALFMFMFDLLLLLLLFFFYSNMQWVFFVTNNWCMLKNLFTFLAIIFKQFFFIKFFSLLFRFLHFFFWVFPLL